MIDYCITCGCRLPIIHGWRRLRCRKCADDMVLAQRRAWKLRRKIARAADVARRALAQRSAGC